MARQVRQDQRHRDLDRAAKTGALDVKIDAASIDFGLEAMNKHAKDESMFNVAKFPTITYTSKSFKFEGEQLVAWTAS
jgi:polyisoprenoid-binding protein YceI